MTSCALLGGSFDPIHNGHLHIAREILKSGYVSRLVFLPNARHNFKKSNVVLDFQHRLALVRDALEPGMEAWEDDADGSGYTAELLQKLYRKHPQLLFHFVIGSDNLANLPLWYDFAWLRANARFLIIPRPGYPLPQNVLRRIKRKNAQDRALSHLFFPDSLTYRGGKINLRLGARKPGTENHRALPSSAGKVAQMQ